MEMMRTRRYGLLQGICLCICILLFGLDGMAQPNLKKYSVRDGMEVIELSRNLPEN